MAKWIKTDNTEERVKPGDEWFTVDEMYAYVGGSFEAIQVTPNQVLYFNGEGEQLELPVNTLATELLHKYKKQHAATILLGNVLMASLQETGDA
jgi:hypothetical protein